MESISETCSSSSSPFYPCENPVNFWPLERGMRKSWPRPVAENPGIPLVWLHFGNRAAGDSSARIARGIGLLIVGACVDYQRRTAVAEDGMWVIAHCKAGRDDGRLGGPIGSHGYVWPVTGVRTVRIVQTVVLHVRIEVPASRCECRPLALRHCV